MTPNTETLIRLAVRNRQATAAARLIDVAKAFEACTDEQLDAGMTRAEILPEPWVMRRWMPTLEALGAITILQERPKLKTARCFRVDRAVLAIIIDECEALRTERLRAG